MITLIALAVMSAAQPLPSLDDFLATFQQKREKLQAVRADFRQENITGGDTESVAGSIFYANPRRLIFRYPSEKLAYAFDDVNVYEYNAETQQVQIGDLSQDPETEALFVGFGESPQRLKEAYNIELFRPDPTDCGSIGMVLKPKGNPEDAPFQEVRLFLREEDYLPCRVVIVNDAESKSIIDVEKYEVNPAYQPHDTQIQAAQGTEVYQHDQYRETVGPGGMWLPEQPVQPKAAPKS